MKLAFSSNAFRKYTLVDTMKILRDVGYQGIEIMCDTPHAWPEDLTPKDVETIKKGLETTDLAISNLNAFMMCKIGDFHNPSWLGKDREKRINHTIKCLKLAGELGAKTISTEPGGPLDNMTRAEAEKIFKEGLFRAETYAKENKAKLLIEPEPGLLIENSKQFDDFIYKINSPHIGLNFDMGHFFCVGEDIPALIRHFGKQIEHVHLEDIAGDRKHIHLSPGEGAIDFDKVFQALDDIKYSGWITVEIYPYQDDAPSRAKSAFKFLERYF